MIEIPVVKEDYWAVQLKSLKFGDTVLCCEDNEHYVIFDTGTTFNAFPAHNYDMILSKLPYTVSDCNTALLDEIFPTLTYTLVSIILYEKECIQDNNLHVEIFPSMYFYTTQNKLCAPGFMNINVSKEHQDNFVFGMTYFKHYFTVFNRGKPSKVNMNIYTCQFIYKNY